MFEIKYESKSYFSKEKKEQIIKNKKIENILYELYCLLTEDDRKKIYADILNKKKSTDDKLKMLIETDNKCKLYIRKEKEKYSKIKNINNINKKRLVEHLQKKE